MLPIELLLFSTSWPRPAPTLPRPRCSLGLPQRRCNRSLPQPSLPPPAASRRCCVCKSRGQDPTRCSSEPSQRALPRVALQAPHVCIRPIRVDKFSVGLTYNCESYAVARHFPRNSFFRGLALALARVHRGARWRPACRLSRPAAPTVPVAAIPRATREHDRLQVFLHARSLMRRSSGRRGACKHARIAWLGAAYVRRARAVGAGGEFGGHVGAGAA